MNFFKWLLPFSPLLGLFASPVYSTTIGSLQSKLDNAMHRRMKDHNDRELSRKLQVSQECIDATNALYTNDATLLALGKAFSAEYDAAWYACEDTLGCSIDEDTFATAAPYVAACDAAGGQILEYSFSGTCRASSADSESILTTWRLLNVDECIAYTECDATEVANRAKFSYEHSFAEVEAVFEELEDLPDAEISVNCWSSFTVRDNGTIGRSDAASIGTGLKIIAAMASFLMV